MAVPAALAATVVVAVAAVVEGQEGDLAVEAAVAALVVVVGLGALLGVGAWPA